MSKKQTVVFSQEITSAWHNSRDARAVKVRADITKGVFWCRNHGFTTDEAYLADENILLDAIKRCGYKYRDAEEFL